MTRSKLVRQRYHRVLYRILSETSGPSNALASPGLRFLKCGSPFGSVVTNFTSLIEVGTITEDENNFNSMTCPQ